MALTICKSCMRTSSGRLVKGSCLRLHSNCFCWEFIANLRHDMFPNSALSAQCIMTCSAYAALDSEYKVYTQQLNLMYCIQTSNTHKTPYFLIALNSDKALLTTQNTSMTSASGVAVDPDTMMQFVNTKESALKSTVQISPWHAWTPAADRCHVFTCHFL